jgi:enoyl-CoA hydratase/carnithine racemase
MAAETPADKIGESIYKTILTDASNGVATVTLNRPERMNAWTPRMGREVRHAIATLDARDDVRAIIVTGAGRAFCAGGDMDEVAQSDTPDDLWPDAREVPFWEMNTPIIAAMNGAAVGAGLTIAMQWDLRVVAEEAKYGFVFNRRGLLPELGSTWIVPRLIGLARATDLLLSGRIITGAEAMDMGLANEAVPAASVLERANAIADDIASNVAPVSAALTKRLMNRFLAEPDRLRATTIEADLFAWTRDQEDAKEGIAAFLEKRPPEWKLGKNTHFPSEYLDGLDRTGDDDK